MPEMPKNLLLDKWYKAFVYLGIAAFVPSLFVEARGGTNGQVQLLSMGSLFFGVGMWRFENVRQRVPITNWFRSQRTGEPLQRRPSGPDILGWIFVVLSGVLVVLGIVGIAFDKIWA